MADLEALAVQLNALLATYGVTRDQIADLMGGSADGGPNGDGRYPVTLASGAQALVPCPARIALLSGDPTQAAAVIQPLLNAATAARADALAARDQALAAASSLSASAGGLMQTIGRPQGSTLVAGNAAIGDYKAVFVNTSSSVKQLKRIRLFGAGTGTGYLSKSIMRDGNIEKTGRVVPFQVAPNYQTFTPTLPIVLAPGEMITVFAPTLIGNDTTKAADGNGFYTLASGAGIGGPGGPYTNQQLQIGFDFESDFQSSYDHATSQVIGHAGPLVAGNSTVGAFGLTFVVPARFKGTIARIEGFATNAGSLTIERRSRAGQTLTAVKSYGVGVKAGPFDQGPSDFGTIPIEAGEVINVYAPGVLASDTTRPGAAFWFIGNNVSPATPGNSDGQDIEIRITLAPETTATQSVQALQSAVDTTRIYRPSPTALRAAVPLVTATQGNICFVGDSMTEFGFPPALTTSWPGVVRSDFLDDIDPDSRVGVTNFGNGITPLSLYGLAGNGIGAVASGPVVQAAGFQNVGSTLSTTTPIRAASFDIWFDRVPGGGNIVVTRAGSGATIATIATDGSASGDEYASVPTGFAGLDTYTFTRAGGPVTITGWRVNGARAASVRAPRFMRFALAGQSTALFSQPARLASIIKQASAGGGKNLYLVALSVNNTFQASGSKTSVVDYEAQHTAILNGLLATGSPALVLGMIRPDPVAFPPVTGTVFDDYAAAQVRSARAAGCVIVRANAIDFVGTGQTTDKLHLNPAGTLTNAGAVEAVLCGPSSSAIGA